MTAETIKVLLVSDEKSRQLFIGGLLSNSTIRMFGLQLEQSIEDAERAVLGAVYDVCIVDEKIGVAKALDLIDRTSKSRDDAPVILLAERDDSSLDAAAMSAGAFDYLVFDQLTPRLLERSIRHAIERKQYEATLHKVQQQTLQLAAIVEGSDYAVMAGTLDGVITSWNGSAQNLFGYSAGEMIGESFRKLAPADRQDEAHRLIQQVRTGKKIESFETIRVAKDGSLIDVALSISPQRDLDGNIIGHSGIAHDIRERKRHEEQILRQVTRIQALRNIDMAITGSLDLRVTLNVLLDQATTQLKVDSAAVLLANPYTHRLEFASGRGFRSTSHERTNLRLGEGAAGRAAIDRSFVFIPDLRENPEDFTRLDLIEGEEFVSYCAIPLISKGNVEGILEIFHRSILNTDSDWVGFLEVLAGQAAIAIENAELFNNLQKSNVELQSAYDSTLEGWSKALDLRDRETDGHSRRVTEKCVDLARVLNVTGNDLLQIRRGALLHDIGKMGIPDSILLKPGPLTDDEWPVMKQHPIYAFELLSTIPYLRGALEIPYCHHEKWDGTGYPRGLKAEQIPLSARIFAVVDVWDALMSNRPYRKAWPIEDVNEYINKNRGLHFDPDIVEIFLSTEYLSD